MPYDSGTGQVGRYWRADLSDLLDDLIATRRRAREMRALAARARANSEAHREANRRLRLRARAWSPD